MNDFDEFIMDVEIKIPRDKPGIDSHSVWFMGNSFFSGCLHS
ncbi:MULTISPECIES: hypothetical protein [unclassified Endozoicomonas]